MVFVSPSQLPSFRSLYRVMPCQSLNTWYRQVKEPKGEAERITSQRGREEVVRAAFLEMAVHELGFTVGEWDLPD